MGINLTIYYNNDLDLFAYTITSQYTSDKFYRVIIDTKALKKSIVGYRQYLIYRKTYNTIINTLKASAINIQFSISSTPFISFITVNTPVSNIKFYIIKANTSFLLYFADIDILKVYYNNLKNILVTLIKSVPVVC
jgi:hypothetical protein